MSNQGALLLKRIQQLTAIALFTSITLPVDPPAQAQSVPAAVAACTAQPEICSVVVAGVGAWYILWRHHMTELCTWGGCKVLQRPPRAEMRANREEHGAATRQGCAAMAARFKKAGRKVRLVDIQPLPGLGTILKFKCIFEGEDAEPGWYGR